MTQPYSYPVSGAGPTAPRVVQGIFGTITESIFGQPDPDDWRPLPLSTLFSEGWNEPWVTSPNGSGGAPRQGWINAADANLYQPGRMHSGCPQHISFSRTTRRKFALESQGARWSERLADREFAPEE